MLRQRQKLLLALKVTLFLLTAAGLAAASWRATTRWRDETDQLTQQAVVLLAEANSTDDSIEQQRLMTEREVLLRSIPGVTNLEWSRLLVAALLYSVSLCFNGLVLRDATAMFGVPCSLGRATASQLLGHMGKYVPGKALVIVLRVWAIELNNPSLDTNGLHEPGSRRAKRIAGAVFVETLLMMSVGATVSGLLAWFLDVPLWIKTAAGLMAAVASVPLFPPLFSRILLVIRRRRGTPSDAVGEVAITWTFLLRGWVWCAVGWGLIGCSIAVLMTSIPWLSSGDEVVAPQDLGAMSLWVVATSAMALGMVLGFASLLPGGAGVRELTTLCVLSPVVGPTHALLTVIAARILFLLVEMVLAAISYLALINTLGRAAEGQ